MPKEEAGWLCDHQSQILFYLTRSVKVNIKPPVKMSKITAAKQTSKLYFQNSMLIPAMFSLESTMLTNLKRSIMPPSRRRNIGWCWPRSTPPSGFFPLLTSQSSWHLIATHSLPLSHKSEEKDPQAATSHNTPWVTPSQSLSHLPSFKSRQFSRGMSLLVFRYCLFFDIKPYWNWIYI